MRTLVSLLAVLCLFFTAAPANAAPVTSTVTLVSAPSQVLVGVSPTASGLVTPAVAGQRVTTEAWTGSSWGTSQVGVTDAKGAFQLPLTYGSNVAGATKYRLTATVSGQVIYSAEFTVTRVAASIIPTVTLSSANGQVYVGQSPVAYGRVTPAAAGIRATTEVWTGSSWATSQTGTTDANGAFQLPLTYGSNKTGSTQFRLTATVSGQVFFSAAFTITRLAVPNVVVTLYSAPPQVVVGATATAYGRVTPAVAGQRATIEAWTGSSWGTSQVSATDSAGAFQVPITYGSNKAGATKFRLTLTGYGKTFYSAEFTITRVVPVANPKVILYSATASVDVGVAPIAYGRFTPAMAGVRVTIEAWTGSAWATSQVGSTDSAGAFQLPLTYGSDKAGATKYRLSATVTGETVYSAEFTITRKEREELVDRTVILVNAPPTVSVGTIATAVGRITPGMAGFPASIEAWTGSSWATSQSGYTDLSSEFRLPLTYGSTTLGPTKYRLAVVAFGTTYRSAEFTITRISGRVYALTAPSYARAGVTASVTAQVESNGTSVAGAKVTTQFLVSGAWSVSQTATTNAQGQVTIPLTYGASTAGVRTWRLATVTQGTTITSNQYTTERYTNGAMPDALLCQVPWAKTGYRIACVALPALTQMNAAYKAATGNQLVVDHVSSPSINCYRTYAAQVLLRAQYLAGTGANASEPGKSSHGWGTACDFNMGGYASYTSPTYKWLAANASKYGFANTVAGEDWHWGYTR